MDMTVHRLHFFREKFPDAEFIDSDELSNNIYDMRTVKNADEIEKIQKAQEIAEKAFDEILGFIRPGITEREIALKLDGCMLENGAESLSFETIALAGKNTSMPHGVPGNYRVQSGDFVLMDFGCQFHGYMSDMTRTVIVGKPDEKQREVYDLTRQMIEDSLAVMKEGARCADVYEASTKAIRDTPYYQYHYNGIGHGIGLFVHEVPFIRPGAEAIYEKNVVTTIEPGLYIPGWGGVRIEDQVIIGENGYENLVRTTHDLIVL